jgi:ParB/RepB/Spo0J family partition protein
MTEKSVQEATSVGKGDGPGGERTYVPAMPIKQLVESPTNPRKSFDAAKLEDLAASIREKGVLEPILARPVVGGGSTWEIVAGARRVRAAKLAGLATVPAIVASLSDQQALEVQVIENLQREDVHPMDEAAGFEALLKHGHDVAGLAARVGKSEAHVYQRLRLLSLSPKCQKLFLEDRFPASTALILARIPSPKLQDQALGEGIADMSSARAAEVIRQRYMLTLASAPFPTDDETLVPTAGSCLKCPKRTGNQQLLFADVKARDLCTDPTCFQAKQRAHVNRRVAQARDAGQRVLTEAEIKKVFPHGGGYVAANSGYVDLGEKDYSARGTPTLREKFAKVLDASDPVSTPVVLATVKTHSGDLELRELIPRKALEQIKREAGVKEAPRNASWQQSPKEKARAEAQKRRFDVMKDVKVRIEAAVLDRKADIQALRWITRCLARRCWRSDAVLERLGVKKPEQLVDRVKSLTEQPLQALLVTLALEEFIDKNGWEYREGYPENLKDACATFGVDLAALDQAAHQVAAARKAAKKAKAPAKATKKAKAPAKVARKAAPKAKATKGRAA